MLVFGTIEKMTKLSELERRVDDLQDQCANYLLDIAKKDSKIAILSSHIDELQVRLVQSESIGSTARKLFNEVDNRVMRMLNSRGKQIKVRRKAHPPILLQGDENYVELLNLSRLYDANEFFSLKKRVSQSQLKPHYRVVAKVYRVSRDGSLRVGSKIYKKLRGPES